jgi:hypothetical protein
MNVERGVEGVPDLNMAGDIEAAVADGPCKINAMTMWSVAFSISTLPSV